MNSCCKINTFWEKKRLDIEGAFRDHFSPTSNALDA